MSRVLSIVLVLVLAFYVSAPVFAKKHPTTTTTAPTTQEAAKGKGSALETHKHRAAEFENGKELDAAKTKDKVGTLSDQVNALDKKLKDSGKGSADADAPATGKHHHAAAPEETPAAPTGKHHHAAAAEETPEPAASGKHHHAATQPATQESKSEKKSK